MHKDFYIDVKYVYFAVVAAHVGQGWMLQGPPEAYNIMHKDYYIDVKYVYFAVATVHVGQGWMLHDKSTQYGLHGTSIIPHNKHVCRMCHRG